MSSKTYMQDVLASMVVFLVAVPLCLGIAIACGLPPSAGLISGVIGGIIVGSLGGCPLQVSGPAAGLVAIVWEVVQTHGIGYLGPIILLAGMMQIGFAWLKLGQWFRAVSPAVVQGMLAGIGVLIFASQFHVMIDDTPKSSGLENILTLPSAFIKGIFPMDGSTHHLAAGIGVLTISIILLWGMIPSKKLKLVPAPLVGVMAAIAVSAYFQMPIKYIHVPADILSEIQWISWDRLLQVLFSNETLITTFTVAIVASTESLLTATAVDQLQKGLRTDYDRELRAQGIGNIIAGVCGALPITGVIVRSSANVQAGAKTRLSSVLHGSWLLVFLLFLPFVLKFVPISSLAAILVYTGYKLVNPANIRKLWTFGKWEVAIYLATITAIVLTNLLEGILLGVGLAALRLLLSQSDLKTSSFSEDGWVKVFLEGSANFISLPKLAEVFETIPPGQDVHVILQNLHYVDHACLEFLLNWEKRYIDDGGQVSLEWDVITSRFPRYQTPLEKTL